jgi:hypothetical protein
VAHAAKVTRSIETPDGTRCVDLTRSPDGTHGFAEYRRDPEDGSGWHPVGVEAAGFVSEAEALSAARDQVAWLGMLLG